MGSSLAVRAGCFDYEGVKDATRALLVALGTDVSAEHVRETPRRVADFWREMLCYEPGITETTFTTIRADQMVLVGGLRIYSVCAHHLLPFWCDLTLGYLTGERLLGLSKFARLAQQVAHRLQVQEGLVEELADLLAGATASADVAVLARGEHLCTMLRGVKMPALMTSSALRGRFRTRPECRAEFMQLALAGARPSREG